MNKGIFYIILSGLCFVVVNFFVKLLGAGNEQVLLPHLQSYPAHELVLARAIVSFCIGLFVIKRKKLPVFGINRKWLLIRGLAGTIALTIFFYTIHHLPFAIASIIQYLAPVFTIIIAMYLLKEHVKKLQWVFIGLSFLGVLIIGLDKVFHASINTEAISYFWFAMGVFSAGLSGIAYTAIMKLKATDAPISIVFFFHMTAIPLMAILCIFEFTIPIGVEWIILLLIGIFTQFAQILLTRALHLGTAATIVPFQYLSAIYAILIGYFLFDEQLSWIVYSGILIVMVSVIVNAVLKGK